MCGYAEIWICVYMNHSAMDSIMDMDSRPVGGGGQVQEMARITVTEIYAKEGGRGQKLVWELGGCLH